MISEAEVREQQSSEAVDTSKMVSKAVGNDKETVWRQTSVRQWAEARQWSVSEAEFSGQQ